MFGEGISKVGELHRSRRQGRHRRENRAPGSPTTASASARAARIRSSSSGTIGRSPTGSKAPSARTPACSPTASWTMRPPPPKTSTRASHRDLPPSRQTESRRGRPRRLFVPQPIIVGIMASSSGERSETRGISGRVGRLCLHRSSDLRRAPSEDDGVDKASPRRWQLGPLLCPLSSDAPVRPKPHLDSASSSLKAHATNTLRVLRPPPELWNP